MVISAHEYSLEVIGVPDVRVRPIGGNVTLDESWSPYVQASVTVPADTAVLAALDPRAGSRVRLSMASRFGAGKPVSVLSAQFVGKTLADLSAAWVGMWLAHLSVTYGEPYNPLLGMVPSTWRRVNLGVRRVSTNHLAGTATIDLASDEALLQDMAHVGTAPAAPAAATVRACVALALDSIGAVLAAGPDDGPVEPDAVLWQPGQTAWDYVDALVKSSGLRLYCDEERRWRLVQPLAPTEGEVVLTGAQLTQLEDDVARDGEWADAVVVAYRWRDSSGVERVRYDVASTGMHTRVMTLEYARPWPGRGAAASILARVLARGHVQGATAVSDYGATPGQVLTIDRGQTRSGLASRVDWSMDTDEMQVRSRDLADEEA